MRKTNLFYLEGNDSNFLTFSNYSEYLTGIILSTNHKIYPSAFLCFNLKFNDSDKSISNFKRTLMCHYENKLAYLRDKVELNNEQFENTIHPLPLLFETIYSFFNEDEISFEYFGDIVEHDYNGTYNDSICIVDFNRVYNNISIEGIQHNNLLKKEQYLLYGWTSDELIDFMPMYDEHDIIMNNDSNYIIDYKLKSSISSISIKRTIDTNHIEFNCVIPLFDINNLNYDKNNAIINESKMSDIELYNSNDETTDVLQKYRYIPYGIWFCGDDKNYENTINLYKKNNNVSQSWSLVISSKFSPYPFGVNINETGTNANYENFTYAQLLSEQTRLLELYEKMLNNVVELSNDVKNLKQTINKQSIYSLDNFKLGIQNDINTLKTYVNDKIDYVDQRLNDLKWTAITNNQI